MRARYICIEGTEGVGKTTQTNNLVQYLKDKGYKVLQTNEPGTPLSPLTMELRKIMLDAQYENEITPYARELISQAIRSIHVEKVIMPALEQYDFIVQDRGILSGLSYGEACGNDIDWLANMADEIVYNAFRDSRDYTELYDVVLYLTGDVSKGLAVAKSSKQEFEAGDAMEARGDSFMHQVSANMNEYANWFNTKKICVDGKNIDDVFGEMLGALELE